MKKITVVLAICAFMISGSQNISFAMEGIPAEVIATEKPKCQGVFPALKDNLELWASHHEQTSKLSSLLDQHQYKEVAKVLVCAKEMDRLYPLIVNDAQTLMGILAELQAQYPHAKNIVTSLLGVEKEVNEIKGNLALFMATNKK